MVHQKKKKKLNIPITCCILPAPIGKECGVEREVITKGGL